MFNLDDFDSWNGEYRNTGTRDVLCWTRREGYFFLTVQQADERHRRGDDFNVFGVHR